MTENGNLVMPVSPMYGGGMGGFGGWGSDAWLILILLFAMGGWGGMGFGGGFGNMALGYDFPWLLNGQDQINANTNSGFDHAATQSAIAGLQNSVTSGFGDVQTSLCSGFAGVNANVSNGFAQAEIANNSRQIVNMQTAFAGQTAMNQGFNGVQSQIAQSGYNTSSGLADVKYTIATEECATRNASINNTRDIIENCNRNNQAVLDKLCQLELDGVKGQLAQAQRENVGLQNQLNMAAFRESQTAQNAFIQQGLTNEVDALYDRLSNCPVPCTPVYGRTPIFTCNNGGCGGVTF